MTAPALICVRVTAIPLAAVVPGSTTTACVDCLEGVWVSPDSWPTLQIEHLEVVCHLCAMGPRRFTACYARTVAWHHALLAQS